MHFFKQNATTTVSTIRLVSPQTEQNLFLSLVGRKALEIVLINKKSFLVYCLILTVFLIFITCAVLIPNFAVKEASETSAYGAASVNADYASAPAENDGNTFFLTAHDGILCIYSCTDNSQILTDAITYIDLYSLDSATKQSLESGIRFENRIEVIRFIEEIGS